MRMRNRIYIFQIPLHIHCNQPSSNQKFKSFLQKLQITLKNNTKFIFCVFKLV